MPPNLKVSQWNGSLHEWIELAAADYFVPAILLEYQRWLQAQLVLPGNVIPFRLVSGRAPKGREFERADRAVFYAADNEPLAGLWRLVSEARGAPKQELRSLLATRVIPGSWPPREMPRRFSCRWGPAPLSLKDRGLKIAHLLNAGRNAVPIEAAELHRRALLTLSLLNCFPMPNSGWVTFSRTGVPTSDLAERTEVQKLLLSFVAEYVGGAVHLAPLFEAYGTSEREALEPEWKRKAQDFRFGVAPKVAGSRTGHAGRSANTDDGPRSFGRAAFDTFDELVPALRAWLMEHPGVARLDDRDTGANGTPYVRFRLEHLHGARFRIERPHFAGQPHSATEYTGNFRLNGDCKADALRRLVEMADNGLSVEEILEPSITKFRVTRNGPSGENPCFILFGTDGADGLYCYPS